MHERKPVVGRSSAASGNETAVGVPGKQTLVQAAMAAHGVAQRQVQSAATAPADPARPAGSGSPLPSATRAQMESSFGADFSAVRVHHDDSAAALGASAYTRGTDVHFAPGQYDPGSREGKGLIGHELAHVVQQSEGRVSATAQAKGVALNDDPALEREADEMGARAAQGEPARGGPASAITLADGPVQAKVVGYQATGAKAKDMLAIAQHLDGCVGKAVAIVAASPMLTGVAGADSGYLGAWVTTYREYIANPNKVPDFFFARYGYAIETLAMKMVGTSLGVYQLRQQVSHGHTRPDLVVVDASETETAWLDITSAGSIGHILQKQHSGWASRPFVAEIVYDMPVPSALAAGSGTLTPDQQEALAKADAAAGARAAAFESACADFAVAIAEALLVEYHSRGAISASAALPVVKATCDKLTGSVVPGTAAVGIVSLLDELTLGGQTNTGKSWASWLPAKPNAAAARVILYAYGAKKMASSSSSSSSSSSGGAAAAAASASSSSGGAAAAAAST